MFKTTIAVSVVIFFFLAGCSQSPMEKLASDTKDERMTSVFLVKEKEGNTPLWQEAYAYCKEHSEKVNCGALILSNIISNGSTKMKGYGHSGDVIDVHDGLPNYPHSNKK